MLTIKEILTFGQLPLFFKRVDNKTKQGNSF